MKSLDSKKILFGKSLDSENDSLSNMFSRWQETIPAHHNSRMEFYWNRPNKEKDYLILRKRAQPNFKKFLKNSELSQLFRYIKDSLPENILRSFNNSSSRIQEKIFEAFARSLYNNIYLNTPFNPFMGFYLLDRRIIPYNNQFIFPFSQDDSRNPRMNIPRETWREFINSKARCIGVSEYFYNHLMPNMLWFYDNDPRDINSLRIEKGLIRDYSETILDIGIASQGAFFVSPRYAFKSYQNIIQEIDPTDLGAIAKGCISRIEKSLDELYKDKFKEKSETKESIHQSYSRLYSEDQLNAIDNLIQDSIINQFKLYFYEVGLENNYSVSERTQFHFEKLLFDNPDLRLPFLKRLQFVFAEREDRKAWVKACENNSSYFKKEEFKTRLKDLVNQLANQVTVFTDDIYDPESWIASPGVDYLIKNYLIEQ